MKVTLMDYTANAKDLLIFSKKTRLNMNVDSYQSVCNLSEEEKAKELYYVFTTISSSWEFVDYTFLLEDVTRAFTHQIVRHRAGTSFAQQALRVVDASDFGYLSTGDCEGEPEYDQAMDLIRNSYRNLIQKGIPPQDARGILPTNILTNILVKVNLRSLAGMMEKRLCFRAQGEFQDVAKEMKRKVLEVHPWTENILQPCCIQHGYCPFPRFRECPFKSRFPEIESTQPLKDRMIKEFEELGTIEFQPTGKP